MLSPNFSIGDIFHSIKGESSHWINKANIMNRKFARQIGYGAFSVSESKVKDVEQYIRNQKEHHKKISYADEIDLLIIKNMDCRLLMVETKSNYMCGYGYLCIYLPIAKAMGCCGLHSGLQIHN